MLLDTYGNFKPQPNQVSILDSFKLMELLGFEHNEDELKYICRSLLGVNLQVLSNDTVEFQHSPATIKHLIRVATLIDLLCENIHPDVARELQAEKETRAWLDEFAKLTKKPKFHMTESINEGVVLESDTKLQGNKLFTDLTTNKGLKLLGKLQADTEMTPEQKLQHLNTVVKTPQQLLRSAADTIDQRGKERDTEGQERSMKAIVEAFNAIEGVSLTERQGWAFMQVLKLVRASATAKNGRYNEDDYLDAAAYAGLANECAGLASK